MSDRRPGPDQPAWIGSVTSHTFTFIPASTRPSVSQKAMNSPLADVAADHDLVVRSPGAP